MSATADLAVGELWSSYVLERDGDAPLRFRGRLASSLGTEHFDRPAWTELRLYKRARGGPVIEVAACRTALGLRDLRTAKAVRTLADALEVVERFDPTHIGALPPVIAARAPAGRLIATVALRLHLARLREDHAALVEHAAALWGCPPARASLAMMIAAQQAAAAALAIQPPRG